MKVHKANGSFVDLTEENWDEVTRGEAPEKVERWRLALIKEPPKPVEVTKGEPDKPVKDKITEETKSIKDKIASFTGKKPRGRKKK